MKNATNLTVETYSDDVVVAAPCGSGFEVVATLEPWCPELAPLLASAPDLLAALRLIADAAEGHVPINQEWIAREARAAIAKAEGR